MIYADHNKNKRNDTDVGWKGGNATICSIDD